MLCEFAVRNCQGQSQFWALHLGVSDFAVRNCQGQSFRCPISGCEILPSHRQQKHASVFGAQSQAVEFCCAFLARQKSGFQGLAENKRLLDGKKPGKVAGCLLQKRKPEDHGDCITGTA